MTTYTIDEFLNLGTYAGTYTISDTAENIQALDSSAVTTMGANGVTTIEATDPLTLTEAEYSDFSTAGIVFSADSDVTLSISGSTAVNLNASTAAAYVAGGVDVLDVSTNYFVSSLVGMLAISKTGIQFASDDVGYIGAYSADYAALSSTDFANLHTVGVRNLSVFGSSFDPVLDAATALNAANAGMSVDTGSFLIVEGTADDFSGFSAEDFVTVSGLAQNITHISVTSGILSLSLEMAIETSEAGGRFSGAGTVALTDTAENIATLSATDIATLKNRGIDDIDASGPLQLSAEQISAFIAQGYSFDDTVTLLDSAGNITMLTGPQLAEFNSWGVDTIDATDTVTLSFEQLSYITDANLAFADGDTVIINDIASNVQDLTAADITALAEAGVDTIEVGAPYTLTLAQATALVGAGISLSPSDTVTLEASLAEISALTVTEINILGDAGFDGFTASDGETGEIQWTISQLDVAMGFGFTALVDGISLTGSFAEITALSSQQLSAYADAGVSSLDIAGSDVALTVEQALQLATGGIPLAAEDTVTISLSAAEFAALTLEELADLSALRVDVYDFGGAASTAATVDFFQASTMFTSNGGIFAEADTVTMTISSLYLGYMIPMAFEAFGAMHIDVLDNTDDILEISLAAYFLSASDNGLRFATNDIITLSDDDIASYSATDLGKIAAVGVDTITTSSEMLTLTIAQAVALVDNGAAFGADMDVTIEVGGDGFLDISAAQLISLSDAGVDAIAITGDDPLDLTVAQAHAIVDQGFALTISNDIVITDTPAALSAISTEAIAALVALRESAPVTIDATGTGAYSLSLDAVQALVDAGIAFAEDDTVDLQLDLTEYKTLTQTDIYGFKSSGIDSVTLRASSTEISALSFSEIDYMGFNGVSVIDSTDDVLNLGPAEASVLVNYGVTFAGSDVVTLVAASVDIGFLEPADFARYGARGFDYIDTTGNAVSFDLEHANAISEAGLKLVANDVASLAAGSADILDLMAGELETLKSTGFDLVDTTENALSLTVAQATLFADAGIGFASDDTVTLIDTAANIATLSAADIAGLASADLIDVIDNALSLSKVQANAFATAGLAFASDDVVTVFDTGASLKTLTTAQIGALGDVGIDRLNASDNKLSLTIAQVNALDEAGITVISSDSVTLSDTGKRIGALSLADIKHLTTTGIDIIDASNNAFTLTVGRYDALGKIKIAANDTLSVVGDGGVDKITASGGTALIYGKGGADVLYGVKAGADTFVFDTKLGAGNIDRIHSFDVAKDHIGLDDGIFKAIGKSLSASEFAIGSAAKDGSDHIIYNEDNGKLFYDADGKGGSAQVQFALLDKGLHLTVHDFDMI
jgi:hypothetical protein